MKKLITNISLSKFAEKATYISGSYTVENRAIPDYRDTKPVHRRILWAMYKMGIKNSGSYKKAARIVGNVIGFYHPHGDKGVADAMVTLANSPEKLIQGQGNWGDYENSAGAVRYIECRLSKFSEQYLLDPIYLAVVPMVPNYDGEDVEPVYLPAKLPNLLINGTEGIATGCSNLIPSFSTTSVIKIIKKGLKGTKFTPKLCKSNLEFKFTYGGTYCGSDEDLLNYYKTGSGSLQFKPDFHIKKNILIITSIAPRFKIGKVLDTVLSFKGVSDVEDKRQGEEIKFNIIMSKSLSKKDKDSLIEKIKTKLITRLPCQTIITIRNDNGEDVDFERTNLPNFLTKWLRYRINLEIKVVKYLIKLEQQNLQKQNWLLFAVNNRKIIILALDNKDPKKYLMKTLKIQEDQADFILNLKVKRLAKLEAKQLRLKIKKHKLEIKILKKDIKNINSRILKQLAKKIG